MKGMRLRVPKGDKVRPTPARVRESLFSILGQRVVDARVLDLFAGSGALGLECLSRGAAHALFVEKDRAVLQVLRENLRGTRVEARAEVRARDVAGALVQLAGEGRSFDLILMDPPYAAGLVGPTLTALATHGLLSEDGIIVIDHPATEALPSGVGGELTRTDRRIYGDTAIALYERER